MVDFYQQWHYLTKNRHLNALSVDRLLLIGFYMVNYFEIKKIAIAIFNHNNLKFKILLTRNDTWDRIIKTDKLMKYFFLTFASIFYVHFKN